MPTNVSTSFFFINLLFQARRAGSNPRPPCIPRCVAARDKSRPWQLAIARAHQEGCARARPSAWVLNSRCVAARDKSRPWRRAMARAHQEGCARARPSAWVRNSRCVAVRDKSRPWRRAMARAHRENCARARGVAGRGLEKPGILRGAWPYGTSRARGGGLMARAYRESCVRARGVVGRGLEGLSHWGVWPGAVHLDWSKSPRWMGARRCAGVPCQAGRGGNRSGPNCFLVSFAQKLDAKNTGIPVKQRERHFAVILVGQGKQFSCIYNF